MLNFSTRNNSYDETMYDVTFEENLPINLPKFEIHNLTVKFIRSKIKKSTIESLETYNQVYKKYGKKFVIKAPDDLINKYRLSYDYSRHSFKNIDFLFLDIIAVQQEFGVLSGPSYFLDIFKNMPIDFNYIKSHFCKQRLIYDTVIFCLNI